MLLSLLRFNTNPACCGGQYTAFQHSHCHEIFLESGLLRIHHQRSFLCTLFIMKAPLLEELIFRASFYRSAHTELSGFVMALLFSFSHFHRSIRKLLKGKNPRWGSSIGQTIFTFIFGIYSFWFLGQFQSVIPSIVLHCYCNFLGPPSISKDNFKWHVMSVASIFAYCWLVV